MTGRGWTLLAACLALLAAGLSTGVPAYYALAFAAGTLLLTCLFSTLLALFSLRVSASCPTVRTVRGGSVSLRLRLRHMGVLPVGSLTLDIVTASEPLTADVACPPFRETVREMEIPCPHRGIYQAGVTRARVEDSFGLFRSSKPISGCSFYIEVAPRAQRRSVMELEPGDTGPEAPSRSAEDASSPSGIRAWRDGDELKKVHWKLTMRRREIMVRTYDETAKPDTLILMDLSPIGALRSQALAIEDAVCEAAATVALSQLAGEYPVRMPLNCSSPVEAAGRSAADMPRFLDALTNARFDCGYPFEQVLGIELRRSQRTGAAIVVTPRLSVRVADIAMQMRRGGTRVRVFWVTESRGGDGAGLVARLSLSGVEVERVNPYEGVA